MQPKPLSPSEVSFVAVNGFLARVPVALNLLMSFWLRYAASAAN